ncbi:MAG: DUF2318 domain-containing protein [Dehalococcoidia bacterium]|nr:DUF2318 domain-containing protein [Dehalococcoidia bacterium]
MKKRIVMGAVLFSLVLAVVACAGPTSTPASNPAPTQTPSPTPTATQEPAPTLNPKPKPSGPIKATWIEPTIIDGDTVSIPLSEVENNWDIHFAVGSPGGDMNFMAYILDEEIHVRANVCPPCRSIGFSLEEDILICDRCATTFKAKTGDGIEGACVDFPKASLPYEIIDGSIIMRGNDLIAAYEDTVKPGWP